MIFALVPSSRKNPLSYPPYHPPSIQQSGTYAKQGELTMSDIPWAMAWYGQRQCVWLTPKVQPDFSEINDLQKPVDVLFLTKITLDSRIITDWITAGSESWPYMILETAQFSTQRDANGQDTWPKHVELRVTQLNPAHQISPLNLGMQSPKISYLPFHYLQKGWPDFISVTTRERPANEE
jgi:hypothetical protein